MKAAGLQNILALRGDPPKGSASFAAVDGGFSCALDLVSFIREAHGAFFGITVAGYPEAHPDAIREDPAEQAAAYASDLAYLKRKVDAGGELVVTQLFYDEPLFAKFVSDCRAVGIRAPIIPGVMPVTSYAGFKRMTGFCKTRVPPALAAQLEAIKDDDAAVAAFGVDHAVGMCRRLLAAGAPGIHLYSLNNDRAAAAILQGLGMVDTASPPRALPFRAPVSLARGRLAERRRPLAFFQAPKAYLRRTAAWTPQQVPTEDGCAGGALPPLPGVCHAEGSAPGASPLPLPPSAWAALARVPLLSPSDIHALFVSRLAPPAAAPAGAPPPPAAWPWAERPAPPPECAAARDAVAPLCAKGALVSCAWGAQHGAPSASPPLGWGPPGGRLFAAPAVEAWIPAPRCDAAAAAVDALPGGGHWAAADAGGRVTGTLPPDRSLPAQWGDFPAEGGGAAVRATPVVADRGAFAAWAAASFAAWGAWADAKEAAGDDAAAALLRATAAGCVLFFAVGADTAAGGRLFDAIAAAL